VIAARGITLTGDDLREVVSLRGSVNRRPVTVGDVQYDAETLVFRGFSGVKETDAGYECTGKEGELHFLVANQYVFRCRYVFFNKESITLVETSADGVGKTVDAASVFTALKELEAGL